MPDIRLAISESAASGTVTVHRCEYRKYSNSARRWRYCGGAPVYDATGEAAQVGAHGGADPGDVYAAQIAPEAGKAGLRGMKGVLAPLSSAFFGLIMLGVTLMVMVFLESPITIWPFISAAGVITVVGVAGMAASITASNT